MTLKEFLDEWHRQANEYGASLTRDQRDIAEQAWLIATQQEREACAKVCDEIEDDYREREGRLYAELKTDAQTGASDCAYRIRARDES